MKQKLTKIEKIILVMFGFVAIISYLYVIIASIISDFFGYEYISKTTGLLFLIFASLNILIVVQLLGVFIQHHSE